MKELSLHILDIAQNSISAGASLTEIRLAECDGLLTVTIADNGKGMTPEFVESVTDPFTTTRTTRKVGMGLPLWKAAAEQAGGAFTLSSAVGVGTTVTASFDLGNIDTPPLGDMPGTMVTIIQGAPDRDFIYAYTRDGQPVVELDTRELREALEDVPLNEPEVLAYIQDNLREETV